MNSRHFGYQNESLALCFLRSQGLRLIARNLQVSYAEIDLLMLDGNVLVFVEVKSSRGQFDPFENLHAHKAAQLLGVVEKFLESFGESCEWRIDALLVHENHGETKIEWIKDLELL